MGHEILTVMYSGRLGDRYSGLGAQKTLFKFSFFSCTVSEQKIR